MRKRFVVLQFGWREMLVAMEPLILIAVAYGLLRAIEERPLVPAVAEGIAAAVGAGVVVSGWVIIVWTFFSWPTLFAGHGVLSEQGLVTRGAYGWVRHPVYLGAFFIWLGFALAFSSGTTLAVAVFYVIPVYVLYIRSEERMMQQSFGDSYDEYRRRVPMLIPRGQLSNRLNRH
jgi:protein-S-isoprenylcysteine O-methyltransferase Ste14